MRAKISFQRVQGSINSIPLHHQRIISTFLDEFKKELPPSQSCYTYSSLKGTSKVQNGFIRFLSSKITLVLAGCDDQYIENLVKKIFERPSVFLGKMELTPRQYQIIPDPEFTTEMKYVCISPLVLTAPETNAEQSQQIIDPTSQEFSDLLYTDLIDHMEKASFSEEELNSFAVFEASPDRSYVTKILESGKKFARIYKDNAGNPMVGYLLPFTLHAHPTVHKFIWDCGLGVLTNQGYGMIDIVREEPPKSESEIRYSREEGSSPQYSPAEQTA